MVNVRVVNFTQGKLTALAKNEGLHLLGVVDLDYPQDYERFVRWLESGKQAQMQFLERYPECRQNPRKLLPGSKRALVLGLSYDQGDKLAKQWNQGQVVPRVAQYARSRDYHKVLKQKGQCIADQLIAQAGGSHQARVVVDTAPVLERALAAKTNFGFIGKNSCFIDVRFGSFLLLAEIFTTVPIEIVPAKATQESCGECDRCQRYCPTGALDEAYTLDANKCLAYWTIEHRGTIPEKFWPWLSLYVFGCDICQLVCPYNRPEPKAIAVKTWQAPELFELATMDQKNYERLVGGTPMTRAKRNGLRRNALIAMTVTSHPRLDEAIQIGKQDNGFPIAQTIDQIERYLVQC